MASLLSKNTKKAVLAILLLCICQTSCTSLSSTSLNTKDIKSAKTLQIRSLKKEVDALAKPMVQTGYTPGLIVGILLPNKKRYFYGYGVADKKSLKKPNKDTLFAVGSLSKGFLAGLTALIVDEGTLSWDDTLLKLLPENQPLSHDAKKITLLQLATHTSGLPRQPHTFDTLRYFINYLFTGESFYTKFDTQYMLKYLTDFSTSESGEHTYSNVGYGLLAHILETHTGQTINELLKQKLVMPLQLTCTGYTPKDLPCYTNSARGYAGDQPKFIDRGAPTPDWTFTNFMRGSAAIHSTANDLLTFAMAHFKNKHSYLNKILRQNLNAIEKQEKEAPAKAWAVDDIDGNNIVYQIGIVAGYTSYLGINTKEKIAVVVLQNSFNWDNTLGHRILLRLINNLNKQDKPALD